ncbi:MAG: hypothetical protein ABF649_18380, partial [Bacillus sp. (in: firmicutes)]
KKNVLLTQKVFFTFRGKRQYSQGLGAGARHFKSASGISLSILVNKKKQYDYVLLFYPYKAQIANQPQVL